MSKGSQTYRRLVDLIGDHLGRLIAETVVEKGCRSSHVPPDALGVMQLPMVLPNLERSIRLFSRGDVQRQACVAALRSFNGSQASNGPVTVAIKTEADVVQARQKAKSAAQELGFRNMEQVRIGTVVSELARNALMYCGSGVVTIRKVIGPREGITVVVEDEGPGIPNLDQVLQGDYRSRTGMGMGLLGSKRLMDALDIDTREGRGTRITATKYKS